MVCSKLQFYPSNSAHMDLVPLICLCYTCAHAHIKRVSSKLCVGYLITKTSRNGPMAHFSFNLPFLVIYANTPKATQNLLIEPNMSQKLQIEVQTRTN
jgi:fructose 1,6-bisphosphatase